MAVQWIIRYWKNNEKASAAWYWWAEGRVASHEKAGMLQVLQAMVKSLNLWWEATKGFKWDSNIIWLCSAKINLRADKKSKMP